MKSRSKKRFYKNIIYNSNKTRGYLRIKPTNMRRKRRLYRGRDAELGAGRVDILKLAIIPRLI